MKNIDNSLSIALPEIVPECVCIRPERFENIIRDVVKYKMMFESSSDEYEIATMERDGFEEELKTLRKEHEKQVAELTDKVEREKESSMFWYKKHEELSKECTELKERVAFLENQLANISKLSGTPDDAPCQEKQQ